MQKGIVDESHIRKAWTEWSRLRDCKIRIPLWRLLAVDEALDSEKIYVEAAAVYAFERADVSESEALMFLAEHRDDFKSEIWDQMIEHFVLPIAVTVDGITGEHRWTFATHDPTRPEVHQLIQSLRLKRFELKYAPERLVGRLITETFLGQNQFLKRLAEAPPIVDFGMDFSAENQDVDKDVLDAEISRSRLINLFEAALVEAVNMGASDLHIFPNSEGHIEIHMRIDGELEKWHLEEGIKPEAFIAVVKDNSINVDRFERDAAQDGYIQRRIDDVLIRFRVSVLPIASARQEIHSESIVIRVLDDRKVLTDMSQLGLLSVAMERFDRAIRQPHGMVILTGPTGSGKSTTLVAALHQVVTPKVNVLTVEDPVEYIMKGIRQIKLGVRLDLEDALRSILRHDPDIVMVGEMRDKATAELAIKLANTGHLTFSTLHTNDAPAAVARLFKMGVEPFLITYAINLVVGQRLIRKLCPECKIPDRTTEKSDLIHFGFSEAEISNGGIYAFGNDPGCPKCKGNGYKGRRAVAETMLFSPAIRSIIMSSENMIDEDALRSKAIEEGMLTLRESARRIVLEGDTSVQEAIRVTGSEF
ncbi:MAG: type II/IV secretion system protein [Bacteroidetes bacterium]|nr:type II/IV secretion system protein [Bacteroidota bacterium]